MEQAATYTARIHPETRIPSVVVAVLAVFGLVLALVAVAAFAASAAALDAAATVGLTALAFTAPFALPVLAVLFAVHLLDEL